jgi:hypothetical protein
MFAHTLECRVVERADCITDTERSSTAVQGTYSNSELQTAAGSTNATLMLLFLSFTYENLSQTQRVSHCFNICSAEESRGSM